MKVKFKKVSENATIPKKASLNAGAFDLTCVDYTIDYSRIATYDTGICVEIPKGFVGLLFPRSSIYKTQLKMCNSVGVIDSDYRGSIMMKYYLDWVDLEKLYTVGDRVGQLLIMPIPEIEFEEVDELGETERGDGGFGSTGR